MSRDRSRDGVLQRTTRGPRGRGRHRLLRSRPPKPKGARNEKVLRRCLPGIPARGDHGAARERGIPRRERPVACLLDDAHGFTRIWWANPDLSGSEQLTFGAFNDWDETWSADGQMLVFSTDRYATAPPPEPGFRVDIVTLNVATGEQQVLTTAP
jgi:hypothetical protein